ncbi:MAG: YidC/Oxa1 family membrane protein insertase [Clostridia bacterium]
MRWLYENITMNSIFLTILISTIVLRGLTVFSDVKQRKSSLKMAAIQPEIQKIQAKYKDDPRKGQQEQSKLMKERGVSMLSGCLPTLITFPLFFCFIAAFRFWGYEQNVFMLLEMDQNVTVAVADGKSANEAEVSKAFLNSKFLWINSIWQPDNGTSPVVMPFEMFYKTPNMQKLIYFKENPEALQKFYDWGFIAKDGETQTEAQLTEAQRKYDELTTPLINQYKGYNNGWFVLPVLAAALQFLYAFLTQRAQQKMAGAAQQQQPGGKLMLYLFPVMSFFFCLTANAAFSLYWTLSSLLMLIINFVINWAMARQEKNNTPQVNG